MKPRRFVTLPSVELVVRLMPAQVRDHLLAIAEAAEWNAANSEAPGSPQAADQADIAAILRRAAADIETAGRANWKDK